ncbi:hypothetical protein RA27_20250 [Ruegeria sp. ANG-R]|uniref:DUF1127 domain-containing protein n=1 Tax=Ruegeria sp. ANG-R TaxID=1577903 RepID=UPI00057E5528|nr:DUF1127 domain-containing protein [Ruegeria sp. ANG-R]KIC38747.1 hypothetical protein RA27_20250 [Ruegeria sp. ANG-R]
MAHVNATAADHRDLFFGQLMDRPEVKTAWQRHRVYRRAIRALEKLNDRELRDIGIPRAEIRHRVYQNVYQNMPYHAHA